MCMYKKGSRRERLAPKIAFVCFMGGNCWQFAPPPPDGALRFDRLRAAVLLPILYPIPPADFGPVAVRVVKI